MPNYQQGKIYKITSTMTDQVYVGSTVKKNINIRFNEHKRNYKQYLKQKFHANMSSFLMLQYEDAKIELIEEYPCNTVEQLYAREQHWISTLPTVNKHKAILTPQEHKQYHAQYFQNHKSERNEYNKRVITCECGMTSTYRHLAKHKRSQRHLNAFNDTLVTTNE